MDFVVLPEVISSKVVMEEMNLKRHYTKRKTVFQNSDKRKEIS